jgi:hypothetical protein
MNRDLWIAIRQALLMIVDAIEKELGLRRTSDLRRELRQQ